MESDAEQIRRNIWIYYIAGMLVTVGVFVLYWIVTAPGIRDYPYVRMAAGIFGTFSVFSGIGIWAKMRWVRWALLMLLLSMYGVFGATHFAKGKTSMFILFFAAVLLPLASYFVWRVIRRFVYGST